MIQIISIDNMHVSKNNSETTFNVYEGMGCGLVGELGGGGVW